MDPPRGFSNGESQHGENEHLQHLFLHLQQEGQQLHQDPPDQMPLKLHFYLENQIQQQQQLLPTLQGTTQLPNSQGLEYEQHVSYSQGSSQLQQLPLSQRSGYLQQLPLSRGLQLPNNSAPDHLGSLDYLGQRQQQQQVLNQQQTQIFIQQRQLEQQQRILQQQQQALLLYTPPGSAPGFTSLPQRPQTVNPNTFNYTLPSSSFQGQDANQNFIMNNYIIPDGGYSVRNCATQPLPQVNHTQPIRRVEQFIGNRGDNSSRSDSFTPLHFSSSQTPNLTSSNTPSNNSTPTSFIQPHTPDRKPIIVLDNLSDNKKYQPFSYEEQEDNEIGRKVKHNRKLFKECLCSRVKEKRKENASDTYKKSKNCFDSNLGYKREIWNMKSPVQKTIDKTITSKFQSIVLDKKEIETLHGETEIDNKVEKNGNISIQEIENESDEEVKQHKEIQYEENLEDLAKGSEQVKQNNVKQNIRLNNFEQNIKSIQNKKIEQNMQAESIENFVLDNQLEPAKSMNKTSFNEDKRFLSGKITTVTEMIHKFQEEKKMNQATIALATNIQMGEKSDESDDYYDEQDYWSAYEPESPLSSDNDDDLNNTLLSKGDKPITNSESKANTNRDSTLAFNEPDLLSLEDLVALNEGWQFPKSRSMRFKEKSSQPTLPILPPTTPKKKSKKKKSKKKKTKND